MPYEEISDFVSEAVDAIDLLPERDTQRRRRRSGSAWFWVLLVIAVVVAFGLVFSA
ncbi:MAG: hypothetical protein AAFR88_04830 [Pseudomonadota bacterium]